jgi:predicted O-linked N-acetylglucosamine transferase (SPINDLY family)
MPHAWGDKIRIGYVSADFWGGHATMKLMQRVLETHDKDRFDITLYCHTPEEHIKMEKGRRDEWGRIVTINHLNHADTAELIRKDGIDILVDLKGYTMGTRNRIFNHMAAPIQVSWLGFPGSTVNVDIDYIIGDHHVLPDTSKPYFHERFCRLPDSYQPNDPVYRPRMEPVTRKDVGLPEDVFVYASFNATRKISLPTIELWSNILKRTKNSVIWIMSGHARTKANILKRFTANGIAPSRVLFMPKIAYQFHVNRMQIADLGLDTFPINGHTTTSEQLWAGLPVLTVKGTNFASRVSESLLNAIGTPDLIAETNQAYEDMAVALCENPERIAAYKQTLVDNRFVKPLFDADRFRHHLESAYVTMVDRAKAGLDPDHFDVPALPARTEPFMAE